MARNTGKKEECEDERQRLLSTGRRGEEGRVNRKKRQRQEAVLPVLEPVKIMSGCYKISSGTQKVEVTLQHS